MMAKVKWCALVEMDLSFKKTNLVARVSPRRQCSDCIMFLESARSLYLMDYIVDKLQESKRI